MGKIRKGVKCSIQGCEEKAVRSIPVAQFNQVRSQLKLKANVQSRAYLCEKHYKAIRKELKRLRKIERKRFGI